MALHWIGSDESAMTNIYDAIASMVSPGHDELTVR